MFSIFGLPDTIVSHNGTQFTSNDFQNFCKYYAFEHITKPPYHSRSIGQAERFADTFKRVLKKLNG